MRLKSIFTNSLGYSYQELQVYLEMCFIGISTWRLSFYTGSGFNSPLSFPNSLEGIFAEGAFNSKAFMASFGGFTAIRGGPWRGEIFLRFSANHCKKSLFGEPLLFPEGFSTRFLAWGDRALWSTNFVKKGPLLGAINILGVEALILGTFGGPYKEKRCCGRGPYTVAQKSLWGRHFYTAPYGRNRPLGGTIS